MTHEHDALPLPDFDHVLIGHLPSRIASLDADDLATLVAYEKDHAHRLPVLQVLEHRIDALAHGAKRSGSVPEGMPENTSARGRGSKVSPVTAGPAVDPARARVMGNPTQP